MMHIFTKYLSSIWPIIQFYFTIVLIIHFTSLTILLHHFFFSLILLVYNERDGHPFGGCKLIIRLWLVSRSSHGRDRMVVGFTTTYHY
jgi:hypothetical protein